MTTLMATGIRLSELVALHCQSITGEPGAYQLDVTGKGAKYRAIPAMDGLVDRVTNYQTERRERFPKHRLDRRSTPLFVHIHTGQSITTRQVQYLADRIYREAGIRAQVPDGALVHALRHTFAMDLLDHGASIVEVQTLLGHESVATTRRYLTARPHQLRAAVAATSTGAALRRSTPEDGDG
ncbi:MAG: tyrosine-type recombinase/integrase [Acidimicrobiales bacterium]|nr:tyrosine-type recombinase/integrase [Acidimicrobiia bacterium]NNF54622.1 tyrosine-type recombinase/integrase [Acidimicrobiales bacterium]